MNNKRRRRPCKVKRERLKNSRIELTDFVFREGGNVYVFSYEKDGSRRHTFIDSGDRRHRDLFMKLLPEEGIDPAAIERIIITHRHLDHCGLTAWLAGKSGATIIAHPGFRDFVEGRVPEEEKWWLRGFDPTALKEYPIEYPSLKEGIRIGGVPFPLLGEPVDMGGEGVLRILACPESENKHTDDQLIVLYSPSGQLRKKENPDHFMPADDIIFCGDLWLMRGPFQELSMIKNISMGLKFMRYRIMGRMSGHPVPKIRVRQQDAAAKEALKTGFFMIRVKPGHGEEFLGSRIIPKSLLADRDLLVELGFDLNRDKSILNSNEMAPQAEALRERAYLDFIKELSAWREWGYGTDDISGFLVRIFREQQGGDGSIKRDRRQRRRWLRATLNRLVKDRGLRDEEFRGIAESTLSRI